MNYAQTIDWLYNQLPFYQNQGETAYKKDIGNVLNFCKNFGNRYSEFDSIHVAGTNGKGSVCHMLSSIYQSNGYKVGLFTSPHILDFRERIKINGQKVPEDFVVKFIATYKDYFTNSQMSFFEMNVVMAFEYFSSHKVDLAIIEVGLGGRLDATNIIKPKLSIITNISLDHTNLLGNTVESIALEKSGIIKNQTPVLVSPNTTYTHIIENEAIQKDAPIYYVKEHTYDSDLLGDYQKNNINTAISAINILQYNISDLHIRLGLSNIISNTGILGRWQTILKSPLVICDVAHNADAIKSLCDQLDSYSLPKHIIIGFSNDKDIKEIVSLLPTNYTYYICHSTNIRIIKPDLIQSYFRDFKLSYKLFNSSPEAYCNIKENIKEEHMVMVTGSTFIVADILKYFGKV